MSYRFKRSFFHDNSSFVASKCYIVLLACLTICGYVGGQQSSSVTSANQHQHLDVNFQDHCVQGCPFQNRTDGGHFDVGCGIDCNVEQCAHGCTLWRQALETSCRAVCNGTQELLPSKQLYCVIGCNDALNRYFQHLKTDLGALPAPTLVPDSLTATSLRLAWSWNKGRRKEGVNNISENVVNAEKRDEKLLVGVGVNGIPHVRYLVQWRYEELAAEWQYCRNQTFGSQEDTVYVDNLQPYTKYRFRVAVLLSPHYHSPLVVSEPSVVISTLAKGVPSSAPIITRSAAVDASRISVSWEPGPFPNGPILSYVLQITPLEPNSNNDDGNNDDNSTTTDGKDQGQKKFSATTYPVLKDIPASGNTDFYMFNNLAPSSKYKMDVSMRNSVGQGPPATVTVTTPSETTVKDTEQPILILGTFHSVIQQSADMLEEPVVIYNTMETIRGVAIHVNLKLLFVSESAGYVYRTSLIKHTTPTRILSPGSVKFKPLDLTVDWLNEQLYILGEVKHTAASRVWQIARCSLDGQSLGVAMAGLVTKPHHIEVDPYNGYLFWVSSTGLWRLDLADISNGVRREVRPKQLLNSSRLGAFTVDHTNFRLLVPQHDDNTIISVSLDGREVLDLRNNTHKPMFRNVTSLAMAKGLFYWISGGELIAEEYHSGQDSYFHNAFPEFSDRHLFALSVNLHSCQPVPLPVNPPTDVQAILGSNKAKVAWKSPHLVGGQSKGAWQNWLYELIIHDKTHDTTNVYRKINTTSYTTYDLEENTEYVFKTAAYTTSGFGPFSSEFHGKTLKTPKDGKYAMIVWSAAQGLLISDVTGDNVKTLISKSSLKDFYFTDIAWYKEKLYLVTNTTHVYWYDLVKNEKGKINEIESVESIAVDWIGKKLYWSNPKRQLIIRGNLNGSQHEPLPILTLARELNIDSVNAYIYWSTGQAVESARLNGAERRTYYPAQLFSGKQVMGLTFDIEQHSLYWIVRSYQGSTLFRAPTSDVLLNQKLHPGIEVPTNLLHQTVLQHNTMQGPLCFFSQKLLWLQDRRNALIGDLNGQNAGVLSGIGLSGLNMVAVVDNALHAIPDTTDSDINVIPDPVDPSTVRVSGPWYDFNISWDPVKNVNYGVVFYETKINDYFDTNATQPKTSVSIKYPQKITPYSKIEIIIRAYTYWGSAPQTRITLNSPQSAPSSPQNLRAFITFQRRPLEGRNIVGTLRWNKPLHTNGVIKGYIFNSWYLDRNDVRVPVFEDLRLRDDQYEFEMDEMLSDTTYFFVIQAYTEAGKGNASETIIISTENELPIPKLLIATEDTILIRDFDNDENEIIARSNGRIIDFAYIYNETKIIWMNDLQEVFCSDILKHDKIKILTLNATGVSLAVDWVNRSLYWAQNDILTRNSTVYVFDFNAFEKGMIKIDKILEVSATIQHIEVSPLTNSLYWTEITHNRTTIKTMRISRSGDKNIRPFLSDKQSNINQNVCNCASQTSVETTFRLDHSDESKLKLIYVESATRQIISADIDGCICRKVDMNFPPNTIIKSLSTEFDTVYLLDAEKIYKNNHEPYDSSHFELISSIGYHCQPYPSRNCLKPQQISRVVDVRNVSSSSLKLAMPEPSREDQCYNLPMPTVQYNVFYMPYDDSDVLQCDLTCSNILTFEKELIVDGLRPFSKYFFSVSLSNYYSEVLHETPIIGLGIVAQTAAGAPTKPRNVTAIVLNPTTVKVSWLPPREFNDEAVSYKTRISTEGTVTSGNHRMKSKIEEANQSSSDMEKHHLKTETTDLEKLLPNQTYTISIRAYSKNSDLYTDSDPVQIETYPEPQEIKLLSVSPYSLNVSWSTSPEIVRHQIEYTTVGSNSWTTLNESNIKKIDREHEMYQVNELQPKFKYIFRLVLIYPKTDVPYIWPEDGKFTFETLGDRPSPPGVPIVQHIQQDVYQVTWKPSRENGSPIQMYKLEGRSDGTRRSDMLAKAEAKERENELYNSLYGDRKRRSVIRTENESNGGNSSAMFVINDYEKEMNGSDREDKKDQMQIANHSRLYSEGPFVDEDEVEWETYYNGTENYWLISDLVTGQNYWFRASALNSYGWSDPSDMSVSFEPGVGASEARLAHKPQQWTIILAIIVPVLVTITIAGLGCFVCVFKQRNKEKKPHQTIAPVRTLGPDVELATLRDMPRGRPGSTFVASTNALYTSSDGTPIMGVTDSLPHIRRDQITLTKFLGSGAFGEVFEGKAKCLDGISGETRVAVKTLRKGASTQERAEFLREAQLMAHFRHPHILRLLGVCRDNDPHFIIMELMLAGDLLSYLRISRPLLQTPQALTLLDLFSMCVDVARGCRYLEEQHFVHRDLACRNCLVSSSDPAARVVKIGDFGLARDVYKNDYYRKEGEGLLPVRWMAPESLVDGVFTSQSDVWAFGVLIWEIMTLGQQPYPARTNLEVLHYVRNGGRLHRPNNCREELHDLMLNCWSYNPEVRPTFKHCLEVLERLKGQCTASPLSLISSSETSGGCYITPARNNVGNNSSYSNEPSPDPVQTPARQSTIPPQSSPEHPSLESQQSGAPKYLEIIYDSEDAPPTSLTSADGYEIPRSSIRSNRSFTEKNSGTSTQFERPRALSSSSTKSGSSTSQTTELYRNGSIRNEDTNRELLSRIEKYLPRNGVKQTSDQYKGPEKVKCAYSNVRQTETTGTERYGSLRIASDEIRQENRLSFNSHTMC